MMNGKDDKSYSIDGIRDLNLTHTFECGQCFRWEKQEDGSFTGAAMGRIVNMRFDEDAEGSRRVRRNVRTHRPAHYRAMYRNGV